MKPPLTKFQYDRDMILGRIALWIVCDTGLPIQWAPGWLITSAGFYAYSPDGEGYDDYVARWEEM